MKAPADGRAIVAVDLGAQSCRVSLLRWREGEPRVELVSRTPNAPVFHDGELRWNLSALCDAADEGLRRCAAIASEGIAAVGVTGWAVDYVRLESHLDSQTADGAPSLPIADPFCYRDARTTSAFQQVHHRISPETLYALTGIQGLPLNTLYQLFADNASGVPKNLRWLNLPEYMLYRWGARPVAEYTNATHTGMVEFGTKQWSPEIFQAAGIDPVTAPQIVPPGSIVGRLRGPLSDLPALRDTLLIAPACHDTASAIAGIHASGDDWAYISSGTWSLVGTVLEQPCASPEAARLGFTNEGGFGGSICFLRNVNGLWLLSQCEEAWQAAGERWTTEDLIDAAEKLPRPQFLLDVDDPEFIAPREMPQKIARQLERNHGVAAAAISSPPAVANLIFHSLAARYATCLREVEVLSGKKFRRLFIVGGGCRNRLLNRLTQQATGLALECGVSESSTIGNFSVQISALSEQTQSTANNGPHRETVAFWAGKLLESQHAFSGTETAPSFLAAMKENHS